MSTFIALTIKVSKKISKHLSFNPCYVFLELVTLMLPKISTIYNEYLINPF